MRASIEGEEFRSGWPQLLAATLGNAAGVGAIMYYSISSFMLPLEREFGWNRSDMGFAVSCLVFGWILVMPMLGAVCDRFGARLPILISIPLLALVLATLSQLDGNLTQLYVTFFLGAVLGSGTLGISYIAVVSPMFVENRGLAYGITLAGTGISAFLLPLGLHQLISIFDWRIAWLALSVITLLQWPIAYCCIPSGANVSKYGSGDSLSPDSGKTLRQALASRKFWLLSGAFLVIALLLSGLLINLIPLMVDRGMTPEQAAVATSGIGLGLLFARVFVGYLLDRLPARLVAILAFAIAALGCVLLERGEPGLAALGALALGFTVGSELDLLAYMTARYFGTRAHASIYALSLSIFYIGAVLAPLLVGELHAHTQDYSLVLQATIASCLAASVLVLLLGPYPMFQTKQNKLLEIVQ